MHAAGNDLGAPRSTSLPCQPSLAHLGEPLREIREDFSGYLTSPAPGAQDTRERNRGNQFGVHLLENFEREALLELHSSRPEDGADGVAGLRTASKPVLDPFGVQFNRCRVLGRVVGSHNFREPAVAGTPFIDHHDAITRHLLLAISSQADSEHSVIPPSIYCISE